MVELEGAGEILNDNTAANSDGANRAVRDASAEAGGEGLATPNKMKTHNHPFPGSTAASSTAPATPGGQTPST